MCNRQNSKLSVGIPVVCEGMQHEMVMFFWLCFSRLVSHFNFCIKMIREELVTQSDLIDAIHEALDRKGITGKIKAQLRTEVFHTLEDKTVVSPDKPRDVFIASELMREFLMSFNLQNSLSVFSEEFGQSSEMNVDREFIGGELGLNVGGCNDKIPLLVLIVQHLCNSKANIVDHLDDSIMADTDSVTNE
jgi:lisH domain-containing protein FOPNL